MLKSVEFGRFMTPEGTEKLILAFTSKKGQSVAHNKHRIFLFGFACQREDLFRHFIGLISFRLQTLRVLVIELNKEFFCIFYRFLAPFNQLQCSATLIYGTTFPGSTKIHSTSPTGCCKVDMNQWISIPEY